jgi:hypothetical protein
MQKLVSKQYYLCENLESLLRGIVFQHVQSFLLHAVCETSESNCGNCTRKHDELINTLVRKLR